MWVIVVQEFLNFIIQFHYKIIYGPFSLPPKPHGQSRFSTSQETAVFNKHTQELVPLGWVSTKPLLDVGGAEHSSALVPLSSPCSQQEEIVTLGGIFHVTTYR